MHLPFTPNHVHLVSACYPPSAALLTSGPDYLPNSQELSRLTYYASNRPGKIHKLASELEKRVKTDTKKAQAGNTRSRACVIPCYTCVVFRVQALYRSLLITLYIFKALAAECRRDIALLTSFLVSAVNTTLSALLSDLEVVARAATVVCAPNDVSAILIMYLPHSLQHGQPIQTVISLAWTEKSPRITCHACNTSPTWESRGSMIVRLGIGMPSSLSSF